MARWIGPRGWTFDVRELGGRQIIHLGQYGAIVADLVTLPQLEQALALHDLTLGDFAEPPARRAPTGR